MFDLAPGRSAEDGPAPGAVPDSLELLGRPGHPPVVRDERVEDWEDFVEGVLVLSAPLEAFILQRRPCAREEEGAEAEDISNLV